MMIRLYGIPNCDSVRKARKWLDARGVAYTFHDFKKDGADPARVAAWIAARGLDTVLNRRGTTWRKLSDADKARAHGNEAVSLLVQHPSLIKRPVAELGEGPDGRILVGFEDNEWDVHIS